MKNRKRTYRYTLLFKQSVLNEIKKENLTVTGAGKYYDVPYQTIYRWMKKEHIPNPRMEVFYVSLSEKNTAIKQIEKLKKELTELKGAVSDLTLKNLCLEKLIELGKREYNIDLKKSSNTRQQKKCEKK